jgi:DnaJ-class molecular chaperone
MICTHCNGYGSSLNDPEGVDTCTSCGGTGFRCDHCGSSAFEYRPDNYALCPACNGDIPDEEEECCTPLAPPPPEIITLDITMGVTFEKYSRKDLVR